MLVLNFSAFPDISIDHLFLGIYIQRFDTKRSEKAKKKERNNKETEGTSGKVKKRPN